MGQVWVTCAVIWIVLELVQTFYKRPYHKRLRTTAIWTVVLGVMVILGELSKTRVESTTAFGVYLGMNTLVLTVAAVIVYWLRIGLDRVLALVWKKPS